MRYRAIGAFSPALCAWILVAACGPRPGELIVACPAVAAPLTDRAPGLVPAPSDRPVLSAPGWTPSVREGLEGLLRSAGNPDVPEHQRPVAALDLDGSCLEGDLGVALFLHLIERRAFRFDHAFWDQVPEGVAKEELRRDVEALGDPTVASLAPEELAVHRRLLAFRRVMLEVFEDLREQGEPPAARAWLARILVGHYPDELRQLARDALRLGLRESREEIGSTAGGGELRRAPALRVPDEMRELVSALQRHGFDVWLLTETVQWAAEEAAQLLGVPAHHVIGTRNARDAAGRLLAEIEPPLPGGTGKVLALRMFVGRPPTLVVGDGVADREMLSATRGLALYIDRGDQEMAELARDEEWLVQPSLPSPRGAGPAPPTDEDRREETDEHEPAREEGP